ncbi:hypothetical protein [Nocardia rhamnosiphila]|uniref:Uncharacterized protein n=1 Tax=Nocardia rhamnosiphila TaxID=426716 RepID=A0ABV2X1V5_9NOCA
MTEPSEENSSRRQVTQGGVTPAESVDVHVRIRLSGYAFDYVIAAAGVGNLIADWKRQRWCGAIELFSAPTSGVPRIPCERLYLGR